MCQGISKLLLTIINIVFLVVSLAFIAAGVILAFLPDVIFGQIYDNVKSAAAGTGFQIPASASELEDIPMVHEIGIFFFAFGLVLFVISFMGCCGACCSCCKVMLLLFSIVLIVLMIVEITFFGLFLTEDSPLHDQIKKTVVDKIPDPWMENDPGMFGMTLNIISHNFDCCGMNGVSDYTVSGGGTPLACDAAYHNVGCYDKLQDIIQDNIVYAGLVAAALLLLQLIEVICAIVIYKDTGKISPI